MKRSSSSRSGLILAAAIVVAVGLAASILPWFLLRSRVEWIGLVQVLGAGAALVTGVTAGPLFSRWILEKRTAANSPDLTADQLEAWRQALRLSVLERRVRGEGSQLDQMVRQDTVIEQRVAERAREPDRPKLRVRNRTIPWSAITSEWEQAAGRMVILGEPGYGKTVAALTLLQHINATDSPHEPLAEIFSLAEWYWWQGEHSNERLSDWLAFELSTTYPQLPPQIAKALVDEDLILPVLDGLDEVPAPDRLRCKKAIESYGGRSSPFRPFVLTCRSQEYSELAPEWVTNDREVHLVGLEADQILAVLEERTAGRPGWWAIHERVAEEDPAFLQLFRSPLRLTIALQSYRNRDPDELGQMSASDAEGRLWERLLTLDSPTFGDADARQIRSWLTFLATGLWRNNRQRFWLHELHVLASSGGRELRRFRVYAGLVFGLIVGVTLRLLGQHGFAVIAGLVTGLIAGLVSNAAPRIPVQVSWKRRLDAVRHRKLRTLVKGLAVGLVTGLIFMPQGSRITIIVTLVAVLVTLLLSALRDFMTAGTKLISADPSGQFDIQGRRDILSQARDSGIVLFLVSGLAFSLTVALAFGLVGGAQHGLRHAVMNGRNAWLQVGLPGGLLLIGPLIGLEAGLGAWLFHHWLRRRLARQGLIPRQFEQFLDWCIAPQRGWLREAGAYEFRHRELLEHLARPEQVRSGSGRLTPEAGANRHIRR